MIYILCAVPRTLRDIRIVKTWTTLQMMHRKPASRWPCPKVCKLTKYHVAASPRGVVPAVSLVTSPRIHGPVCHALPRGGCHSYLALPPDAFSASHNSAPTRDGIILSWITRSALFNRGNLIGILLSRFAGRQSAITRCLANVFCYNLLIYYCCTYVSRIIGWKLII